jgi:photosystem II stability/assembly factor-like uncharacterized protein
MKDNTYTRIQKNKLFIIIYGFSFFLTQISFGQTPENWLKVGEKSTNFYDIKNAFMRENAAKLATFQANKIDTTQSDGGEEEEENRELIKYSRWAEWFEPRVWESKGDLSIIAQKEFEIRNALLNSPNSPSALNAAWTLLGPINQTNNMFGNGRVNNIRIDPTNSSILYACTPASQLFKSINGGTSWTSISNGILATGVTDVAIDPTATNTLYAVTGDGDQAIYHPYSSGVYKSTNGGTTWSATGLSYSQGNGVGLTSIIINPTNTSIIIVGGTNGIFRSINGGTSFTQTSTQATRDLVFKPGDPNIVFAGSKYGGVFLRSADGGATWTQITSGLPASGTAIRYAIDVSPANTNYVYAMATDGSANLLGFYRSTDGGLNFTSMSTTPNIAGGQGWYDLAVAADPLTANTVYAAGIDIHKSIDGGVTWTNLTNVYTSPAANTHPDVHDLTFAGTSTLYITNDGGVYKTINAGTSWTNISSNLSIAQPYGIGLSATNANLIISGHQDNGTNLTSDLLNWKQVAGGDGMIGFIDRTNDNIMYSSSQNGGLRRSTNGGTSFSSFTSGFAGGYWVTPYVQDPITANVVYAGGTYVYKSVAGAAWTAISPSFSSVRWIDIARNNNQIIYALNSSTLYKTIDGGINWTNLTTLPSGGVLHVHIDVNDPNIVYVSKASYSGNGVYRSTDAGATWVLWATGLPNLPVNTVVTQIGRPGEVYCGTDMGVYYRNSSAISWTAFLTGLPSIPVRDLEIFYPTGKLRAATFGRGIWETPLNVLPCNVYTSNTIYVNALAIGANNGLSWINAFVDLQSALDVARICTTITQIWVAAGTYMPTMTTDRNINFSMINGVAIYGGFPNTGNPTFAQRNLAANKTTLSGDIGTIGTKTDNSYHVINNPAGINNTAILDGFVIELGNANGTATNTNIGGGMLNNSGVSPSLCSPKIDNCIFVNNSALANGGAVFNNAVGGNSNPIFTNCIFQKNNAVNGGAVYSDGRTAGTSSPVFINCSFDNNSGTANGSVLYNLCTSGTCLPDFKNCIFWNNAGAKTFFNNNATITASYSFLESTVTNYTNAIGNIINSTSPFVTAISDLHLNPCTSPAINTGNNAANSTTKDLDGNLRKFGVIDMGAYEYQSNQVLLPTGTSNLTICNNTTASFTATCAGGLVKWYDALGTSLEFTGSPFNVPNLTMNKAYKVRCDDGICTSNFVDVSVSVNPIPPTPSVVQTDTTIAVGENLTLTALGCLSGGGNYVQWYKAVDNSLVTMPISPTLIGSYYAKCIEMTNSVACAGAKSINVEVSIADIISIITGNWENSSIWNLGRVPYATDFVIIGNNHTVTVTTNGAVAKKILYRNNAKISLGSDTVKLKLGN